MGCGQPPFRLLGEDVAVTRSRAAALVCLAGWAILSGLSGCGDAGAPKAAPTTAPPPVASAVPRPVASGCHTLTHDQALGSTVPDQDVDVPCSASHTAQTYAVGALDTLVAGHLLAVDSDRVRAQLATRCSAALGRFVGGSAEALRLSMLHATWFRPTVEQAADGADWYRCDVVVPSGEDALETFTGSLKGVLDAGTSTGAASDWAMCGTAQPGAAGFRRVPCRERHSWKALSTVALPAGAYPGEAKVKEIGQKPCQQAGRDVAKDALDYQWGYEWPTQQQWEAGQTYGICWAPSV